MSFVSRPVQEPMYYQFSAAAQGAGENGLAQRIGRGIARGVKACAWLGVAGLTAIGSTPYWSKAAAYVLPPHVTSLENALALCVLAAATTVITGSLAIAGHFLFPKRTAPRPNRRVPEVQPQA